MHYDLGGPIRGVRTGFAKPKKTTVPLPPKWVDSAGSGASSKPCSGVNMEPLDPGQRAGDLVR